MKADAACERRDGSTAFPPWTTQSNDRSLIMRFLILSLCLIQLGQSYFWDLELDLHGSLKRGSQLPTQTGGYLKESFRSSVLIPTFQEIIRGMREQKKENVIQDVLLGSLALLFIGGLVYCYARTNKSRLAKSFKASTRTRALEMAEKV